ncbi:hypothetical protein [Paucibacter soli]|uniref:hypothetical protein n=1 Tax=Paucibacter soli TaxID=3133433 RepID=UPI0030A88672
MTVIFGILLCSYWQAVRPVVSQAMVILQGGHSLPERVGAVVAMSFLAGMACFMVYKSWQWLGRFEVRVFAARKQDDQVSVQSAPMDFDAAATQLLGEVCFQRVSGGPLHRTSVCQEIAMKLLAGEIVEHGEALQVVRQVARRIWHDQQVAEARWDLDQARG